MFEISLTIVALLFLIAFIAGYIDTLVGGGGLITIPALLFIGLSPIAALATNKLQAIGGSGTASFTLIQTQHLAFKQVKWLMLLSFVGASIGAFTVQLMDVNFLTIVIPCVLIFIAAYFLISPQVTPISVQNKLYRPWVALIGCYDGVLGPGTGSFFAWAGVSRRGQDLITATMVAKTLNFASNLAALLVFILLDHVVWVVGGVMLIGQILGARLAAHRLVTIDPTLLRYGVVIMSLALLVVWFI